MFDNEKSLLVFDAFRIFVSLLDIFSDICMTYVFWLNEQYTYFYISISILIITHLLYCGLFVYLFKFDHYRSGIIFLLLPISPFLFYFTAKDDNELSKWLQKLFKIRNIRNLPNRKIQLYQEKDTIRRLIQKNFRKHIGFVCQSIFESFCQFSLQLFVIIRSNEYNTNSAHFVQYFSILLSLLSI
eukprot:212972_1